MTTRKERPILFSGPMVRALLDGRKTVTRRVLNPQPPEWAQHVNALTQPNDRFEWKPNGLFQWSEVEQTPPRPLRRWPTDECGDDYAIPCPYGRWPGDRLWVKETWHTSVGADSRKPTDLQHQGWPLWYAADGADAQPRFTGARDGGPAFMTKGKTRVSIHMPRWASRLTLAVVSVRVERLHDITEEDAVLEGCVPYVHESWSAWDPETQGYPEFTVEPDAEMVERRRLENVRHHKPKVIATTRDQFRTLWTTINGAESWAANPWVWRVEFRRVETA